MSDTLQRLIVVTDDFVRDRGLPVEWAGATACTAISQDALIFGLDVDEYVAVLTEEFGEIALQIPWLHFTDQAASFRGCAVVIAPFWLVGRVIRRIFVAGPIIASPDPKNFPSRLELRHIARVIEEGQWIEP